MISRRDFIKGLSVGCVAALADPHFLSAKLTARRPNVVFFLVDDLGWADLSSYGSTFYETPNLDKLASQGMRFTDAYASCPVCSPTRAALMIGKYQQRVQITNYGSRDLPREEITLAESLGSEGYKTFFAGKWHLGRSVYPTDQGFDTNIGGYHRGSPNSYYTPYENPELPDGPDGEYLTDRLADETIRFIEDNKDDPFLAYLAFYTVHTPTTACEKHIAKFNKKLEGLPKTTQKAIQEESGITRARQDHPDYASMIYAMDENIGRVLKKLDELKLTKNTVVIFTSDNGGRATLIPYAGETCNLPLRAGKGWCYEGGIRVPAIIRAPGVTKAGSVNATPIICMDYYPTILDLTGSKPNPEQHCDGVSVAPLLRGKKSLKREALYWSYPHRHGSGWQGGAAVRAGDWKLIEFYGLKKIELYNLKDDIGEQNDLSKKMPEKANELLAMLKQWKEEVGAASTMLPERY